MSVSHSWKEYLHFSKRDRIAILVLLAVIALLFFLPPVLKTSDKPVTGNDTAWIASLKKLEQAPAYHPKSPDEDDDENSQQYQYDRPAGHYPPEIQKGQLFYFDPNTVDAEGWQRLGLRDKTIHTIQNYLSKGGRFRKPEDLQRIYGLFPDEYDRIAPYIIIAPSLHEKNEIAANEASPPFSKPAAQSYTVTDINTADTSALIALPGIGSKLANRIIGFRDKLGGFYSISQVAETYGLADSVFQKIKQYLKLSGSVKKLNINTATVDELKAHPYIRWAIANPLVAYRNQHGRFASIEDIKKVMAVTEDVYQKISPYITVE